MDAYFHNICLEDSKFKAIFTQEHSVFYLLRNMKGQDLTFLFVKFGYKEFQLRKCTICIFLIRIVSDPFSGSNHNHRWQKWKSQRKFLWVSNFYFSCSFFSNMMISKYNNIITDKDLKSEIEIFVSLKCIVANRYQIQKIYFLIKVETLFCLMT